MYRCSGLAHASGGANDREVGNGLMRGDVVMRCGDSGLGWLLIRFVVLEDLREKVDDWVFGRMWCFMKMGDMDVIRVFFQRDVFGGLEQWPVGYAL